MDSAVLTAPQFVHFREIELQVWIILDTHGYAYPGHGSEHLVELPLLQVRTLQPAAQIAAEKDEPGHPLRILDGIADRKRTALRDAEKGKAIETRSIGNAAHVGDHGVGGNLVHFPVGEAIA